MRVKVGVRGRVRVRVRRVRVRVGRVRARVRVSIVGALPELLRHTPHELCHFHVAQRPDLYVFMVALGGTGGGDGSTSGDGSINKR